MAVISRKHKLLFLLNPRTGSSAVARAMLEHLEGEWLPKDDMRTEQGELQLQWKHNTVPQLIENGLLSKDEANGYVKFTAVRNPYDSLVSLYLKFKDRYVHWLGDKSSWIYANPHILKNIDYCQNHTFNQWIRKEYWRTALAVLIKRKNYSLHSSYLQQIDQVMRFENLENDFRQILKSCNIDKEVEVPRFNETEGKGRPYRDYYSNLSKWLVQVSTRSDLKRFEYSF